MKLLGSTKSKIDKDKNGEYVSHLEVTGVILVYCNIVNNAYQENSRVVYALLLIDHLVNYKIFHPNILCIWKLLTQNFDILKYGLLIIIENA